MRGTRLFSRLTLCVIVLAQFAVGAVSFLGNPETAKADATLPASLWGAIQQNEANVLKLNKDDLYHYYIENVSGATKKFPALARSTCGAPFNPGVTQGDIFRQIYDETYACISEVNEAWMKELLGNTMMHNLFNKKVGFAEVDKKLDSEKKYIGEKIIPHAAYVAAGIKILGAMDADLVLRPVLVKEVGGEERYKQMIADLDVSNNKRLVKPAELNTQLKKGDGSNIDASSSTIYQGMDGSGNWYPDFALMANLILSATPLTDEASRTALQDSVLAAATTIDNSKSGVDEAAATGDICGDTGIGNLGQLIPVATCEVVLAVRTFSLYFLRSSMSLLVTTAGLPGGEKITSDRALLFSGLSDSAFGGRVENKIVDGKAGTVLRTAYDRVLTIVNTLALILLIITALANTLQLQLNVYSFKKMIPGLILGLILANASIFIVRGMLELAGYAAKGLIPDPTEKSASVNKEYVGSQQLLDSFVSFGVVGGDEKASFQAADKTVNMPLVFQQGMLNVFTIIAAIMIFVLGFLFAIRSLIFFVALPLAPIAFLGLYYPPLGFAWKRWWAFVVNWAFMPVVSFFWLWLGFQWMASVGKDATLFSAFINYIFAIAMIYLAVKTPFTMAGEAKQYLDKWNGLGKSAWKSTAGTADKSLLRPAKTFANTKNILGIPAMRAGLKRLDDAGDDALKNSREGLKSKGRVNKYATKLEGRNSAQKELTGAQLENLRADVEEHDEIYKNVKARAAAIKDVSHELEAITKEEIRIRKNSNKDLESLRNEQDKQKAQLILKGREAEETEAGRVFTFEDSLNHEKILKDIADHEKPGSTPYSAEQKAELMQQVKERSRITRARVETEALKTTQGKLREDTNRMAIVNLQNDLGNDKFVEDIVKRGTEGRLENHRIEQLGSTLKQLEERAVEGKDTKAADVYQKLQTKANTLSGLSDPDQKAAFEEIRKEIEKYNNEKDPVIKELEKQLPRRVGGEESKFLSERGNDIFNNGELGEKIKDRLGKEGQPLVKNFAGVLAGRGSQIKFADDDDMQIVAASARALSSQEYVASDITAVQNMLRDVKTATTDQANLNDPHFIEAKSVMERADAKLKEKLIAAKATPQWKEMKRLGIDNENMTVDEYLEKMKSITGRDRARVTSFLQGSGVARILNLDRSIAAGPSNARGIRPVVE